MSLTRLQTDVERIEAKVDVLLDAVSALVSALAEDGSEDEVMDLDGALTHPDRDENAPL